MAASAARGRKRSHDASEQDHGLAVGQTLALLHEQQVSSVLNGEPQDTSAVSQEINNTDDWEVARSSKKRKKMPRKSGDNYPSITHSPNARITSYVKLSDLQNLILYLLADGPGPQWCAVGNHGNVRRVVALMVPGLEAGMFDGTIPLSTEKDKDTADVMVAGSSEVEPRRNDNSPSTTSASPQLTIPEIFSSDHVTTPDEYYPRRLEQDHLPEPLQAFADMFEHMWPVRAPGDDKFSRMFSPMAAILSAQIVKSKEEKRAKGPLPAKEGKSWKNERTPITEFIATTEELCEEGYALHPAHYHGSSVAAQETTRRENMKTTKADGWVDTSGIIDLSSGEVPEKQIENGSITRGRKILTLDCEMCVTSPPQTMPQIFSLTRISIIDWDGAVVMDEYVKPDDEITDYLTQYSGITPEKLAGVRTTLRDIQAKLMNDIITPQTILIGHSLNSDLNALKITHPYIIDTSLLFPHPRGPPLKSGLKWLAQKYLNREIQRGHGVTGHDSIEDAKACLDLVKQKCEKGSKWGTSEASNESIFKRLGRHHRPKRIKTHPSGDDEPRTGAVVDWGDPSRGFGSAAHIAIGAESDAEVATGVKRALHGDENSSSSSSSTEIPNSGVDFIFARLRQLEAHRGWWNRGKTSDNAALLTSTIQTSDSTPLAEVVATTVHLIKEIYDSLPSCTAFLVFSGSGDPRPLSEMQALYQLHRQEYNVKKWDDLSVKWTDAENLRLRAACKMARMGVGFVGVK